MIVIELFNIKVIRPGKSYEPNRRSRRSKPGIHPFDLLYLIVWKMVGGALKMIDPLRVRLTAHLVRVK